MGILHYILIWWAIGILTWLLIGILDRDLSIKHILQSFLWGLMGPILTIFALVAFGIEISKNEVFNNFISRNLFPDKNEVKVKKTIKKDSCETQLADIRNKMGHVSHLVSMVALLDADDTKEKEKTYIKKNLRMDIENAQEMLEWLRDDNNF